MSLLDISEAGRDILEGLRKPLWRPDAASQRIEQLQDECDRLRAQVKRLKAKALLEMVTGLGVGKEIVWRDYRRRKDDVGAPPWERFWVYRKNKYMWRWAHHGRNDGTAEEAATALEKFLKTR